MRFDMFIRCFVIIYSIVSFFPLVSLLDCLSEPSDPRCSSDAQFVGCYLRDCILQEYSHSSSRMDMTYCFHLCSDRHFILAGLFDGNTCLCACAVSCNASLSDAKDRCGIPCAGNVGEFCGGREAVQTYQANNPSGAAGKCQGIVKVTAPSPSVPSQPNSTSSTVTEPTKVVNHTPTTLTSKSTTAVYVPILASVLGVIMVMVVGIVIFIIFCRKNPSRGVSGEGAIGKERKRSTTDRLENLDQSEGYQPLNTAPPPLPLARAVAPISSDASHTIRADRLGDAKQQVGQHGDLPEKVRPGEASRSPEDAHRPPCPPEDNMTDDQIMGHLYYDIGIVHGPSSMLTSTSSTLGDYAEPSRSDGNSKATTLCLGEPGTHDGKPPVAGRLSPIIEDDCLHPTYDTKMHVCKIHRSSSVYNDYETKVHKSVPSQD